VCDCEALKKLGGLDPQGAVEPLEKKNVNLGWVGLEHQSLLPLVLGGVSGHIYRTLALPPETGSLLHDAGWAPELVWKL
jgi:hypothetical protein